MTTTPETLAQVPGWQKCREHGPAHPSEWACPQCLRDLRQERDSLRARLDRAIHAAEEHFGEDAIRYKLSLFANGRARNVFPASVDGHWFALQRADNDAHIGLSLRCVEAEAARDNLRKQLAAAQTLITSAEARWKIQSEEWGKLTQRAADVDGERAANAILTQEADQLRAEMVAAWNDLPDSIRCHPGLKRLFRACQVA